MSQNDVYTTRQAAERLGVSLRTVQLWVESGILPAWKTAGGHRRISREAVERLVHKRDVALDPDGPDRPFRLLIVEDEDSLRKLYEIKIASWRLPLEILTTANGYEALLLIGDKRPDLLVSDLNMPGIDGFRMIRTLLASPDYRNLEIVVVTALDDTEIADRGGLPEGVRVYRKPIPFGDLEALVRDRCEERAQL